MNISHMHKLTILCILNDEQSKVTYENFLSAKVKRLIVTENCNEAKTLYDKYEPDIVISDIVLSTSKDLELFQDIKTANPCQPIIARVDKSQSDLIFQAFDLNIDGYILKSDDEEKILSKIDYVAHKIYLRNSCIENKEILQNISDHQSAMIILTDFETISYSSKSFLRFFNFKHKDDFFGRFDHVLDIFMKHDNFLHGNSKDEFLLKFEEAKAIKKVVLMLSLDFNPKAYHIYIDKVKQSDLYIVSLSNITISQEVNVEMSHKVYVDGLTGVSNRNKFEEMFSHEFNRFQRDAVPLCISIIDIDFFKKFNDTYGHLIGDEVLIMLANEINVNTRKTDLFARWGGEEFVLLFVQTSIERASEVCENLRKKVEKLNHKTAGGITCSFGVTQVTKEDTLSSVFKRCDSALYSAKESGRNKVCTL